MGDKAPARHVEGEKKDGVHIHAPLPLITYIQDTTLSLRVSFPLNVCFIGVKDEV